MMCDSLAMESEEENAMDCARALSPNKNTSELDLIDVEKRLASLKEVEEEAKVDKPLKPETLKDEPSK